MSRFWNPIVTAITGALAMYYLDPSLGRRRRAMLRDRVLATTRDAEHLALAKARHSSNRARGLLASTLSRVSPLGPPRSDAQLHERIRSRLGRILTVPRAVHVEVDDGYVTLSGRVPSQEHDLLLFAVAAMPGVHHVDNLLVEDDQFVVAQHRSGLRAV